VRRVGFPHASDGKRPLDRAPDEVSPGDFLSGDMTPTDIADMLSHLKFTRGKATVEIDKQESAAPPPEVLRIVCVRYRGLPRANSP
jgi:hypothetical protein